MNSPSPSRGARAVLSRAALKANLRLIQKQLSPSCAVCAVVKADAYGTGAVEVSRVLSQAGVSSFCVATLEEGLQLRRAKIRGEIFTLGPVEPQSLVAAARANIAVSACSRPYLREASRTISKARLSLKIHLKIDTGMHRLGFDEKNADKLWAAQPGLVFESAYTHFYGADASSLTSARRQLFGFLNTNWPETLRLHTCNSIAALRLPEAHLSLVRSGIFLYGAMNPALHPLAKKQREVLSLQAPVVRLQTIAKGEGVSYGPAWRAKKRTRVAAIALGYADGIPRSFSNRGSALIDGKRCSILGRVCMDLLMVDVSRVKNVRVGSSAQLLGKQKKAFISIHEWAALDKSIAYESLTRISGRVPRVWVDR